jgi:hypothetical protein
MPDAPALERLRTSWHGLINHPEIRTIYPPAAQGLFALWTIAGGSLLVWRLILLAFDLATLRILGARSAWLWATCPLVVVEGFWSGLHRTPGLVPPEELGRDQACYDEMLAYLSARGVVLRHAVEEL